MTDLRWWPAPAKLNLFLHITGRRPDGYHLLQTVFQFVSFGDRLAFESRPDGVIHRASDIPGVPGDRDLVLRAARLLQTTAGIREGADIYIEKRIPLGGGLGGGSSDAATTLLVLNHLWGCGLTVRQLARLGLRLGADVPVFVEGRAAWAEGVGEQLQPITLPEPWYVVIVPDCQVETAEIFKDPRLTRNCHPITIEGFLSGQGGNVCEAVATQHCPSIRDALDWLGGYAPARMSGTGASVFAAFEDNGPAQRVCHEAAQKWQVFVGRGMNLSPLHKQLGQVTEAW